MFAQYGIYLIFWRHFYNIGLKYSMESCWLQSVRQQLNKFRVEVGWHCLQCESVHWKKTGARQPFQHLCCVQRDWMNMFSMNFHSFERPTWADVCYSKQIGSFLRLLYRAITSVNGFDVWISQGWNQKTLYVVAHSFIQSLIVFVETPTDWSQVSDG